jgi:excisionase family DNA binding protein
MLSEITKNVTLTVEETSRLLRLSRGATYEAVRRGQLPSIRIGRRILIPRAALEKLLERQDSPNTQGENG